MKKNKTSLFKNAAFAALTVSLLACENNPPAAMAPAEMPMPVVNRQEWILVGFEGPESVAYDSAGKALYVSNMPGGPGDATGKGYISKVSLDGKFVEKNWVAGLNSPKGISVYNGKLYVADLNQLLEIDIATKAVTKHDVAGATFLNDVAVNPKTGVVYVSNTWDFAKLADASGSAIYQLENGAVSAFASGAELNAPNGLSVETVDGTDYLYIVSWGLGLDTATFASTEPGKLLRVALDSKAVSVVKEPLGNSDGVAKTGMGRFVTDYLKGKIMYSTDDVDFKDVLTGLGVGAADIAVNEDDKVLYIPVTGSNYVVAHLLN